MKEFLRSPKNLKIGLFIFAYLAYFYFGLSHLTKFSTADEAIWWTYDRVQTYWSSLLSGNLKGTFINDKPGVSTALISGIGYNLSRESFQEKVQLRLGAPNGYKKTEWQDLNIEKNLLALRLPLLIFNGAFTLLLFWLIKKITDDHWTAFWAFILILLSPILLGISQIINPDTLLWSFSAGTLFSFLAYLKTEKKSFAFISSFCLGMALLSKYSATIFYPFLIMVSFAHFICKIKDWQQAGEKIELKIRRISRVLLGIIAGSILIYAIGMPAVFEIPNLLFGGTIGFPGMEYFLWPLLGINVLLILESFFFKSKLSIFIFSRISNFFKNYSHVVYIFLLIAFLATMANWVSESNLLNIKDRIFDMGKSEKFIGYPLHEKIIYEIRPLVFSLTPLSLFALLFFWAKMSFKKNFNFIAIISSLFFITFYAAVIFQGLMVTIRYSIMLYPLAFLLAAFGLKEIYSTRLFMKINIALFSLIIILVSIGSLWLIKPFYFNYASFILPKKYLITGAWGYGGYEAAQYLNSLPNSENLVIWADYPGVCEFTKGKCYISTRIDNYRIDYFVLTRRGHINYPIRKDRAKALQYYKRNNPEWQLNIDDRPGNYIKVFKNEK